MKATLITDKQSAKNLAPAKELVSAYSAIVSTKEGPHEAVTVRCYMGRSTQASAVYCSIWLHGNNHYNSGHGSARGYGYHKESAALDSAIESAGIKLSKHIDGIGSGAMYEAMEAIVRAMGYKGKTLIIHH